MFYGFNLFVSEKLEDLWKNEPWFIFFDQQFCNKKHTFTRNLDFRLSLQLSLSNNYIRDIRSLLKYSNTHK